MTLPSSGTIALSQINTELGRPDTQTIGLDDASVRALAGIPSGPISLYDLYGKSAAGEQVITFDNSGGAYGAPVSWNLWNILSTYGISLTSATVRIILKNITFTATNTATPALETGAGWPAGTRLTVEFQGGCLVYGSGGAGGAGSLGNTQAGAGGVGGIAYRVTAAISGGTITSQMSGGAAYGGGGGGGGGGGVRSSIKVIEGGTTYTNVWGGNGGTGAGISPQTAGTAGTGTSYYGGAGGAGGGLGAGGAGGAGGYTNYSTSYPGAGGGAGYAIVNAGLSNNINWVAGSNYLGLVA